MGSVVPSLEGSLYLKDPESIIAYQLRRYMRQPADTIPVLSDLIISLPQQVAKFGSAPDTLVTNMQADLQGVFTRIFGNERPVSVTVTHTQTNDRDYDVNISVIYTLLNGDVKPIGTTISLVDGRFKIPEDTIDLRLLSSG